MPVCRSRTNTSAAPLVSPGTRLVASELEGDEAPVRRDRRAEAVPSPWAPPGPTLTRRVVPVWRSRTNTSRAVVGVARHQVGGVRDEGDEAPVRRDRRVEAAAVALGAARPDAHPPGRARLAVADEHVAAPLVSPGTRLVAREAKATKRPSAEIAGSIAVAIALGAARA